MLDRCPTREPLDALLHESGISVSAITTSIASPATTYAPTPTTPTALTTRYPRGFDFERQIAAARPRLARIIQSFGVAHDAIDDLIQETLLTAWRRLDQLRAPGRFDAWLDAICRNRCRMYLRRVRIPVARGQGGLAVLSLDRLGTGESAAGGGVPDPRIGDPVEELSRQDLTALLDQALGELSVPSREALELRYVDEVPERQAAEQLGVSVSAFEARLHRARLQLRRALGGPLRSQAEQVGLVWHMGDTELGWQQTRIWCDICGRRRLLGIFERKAHGETWMRLRCPDCSKRFEIDIHSDYGIASPAGIHTFRPALNRIMRRLFDDGIQRLEEGRGPCPRCGAIVPVRLVGPSERPTSHKVSERIPIRCWLEFACPAHSHSLNMSAVEPLIWFHPLARRFTEEHPRWVTTPETLTEYGGRGAIRFRLVDVAGSAKLLVFADPISLRIFAAIEE